MTQDYRIEKKDGKNVYVFEGKDYETHYSKEIIDAFVDRKGPKRTVEYLTHGDKRSSFIKPLFEYLSKKGKKNLEY